MALYKFRIIIIIIITISAINESFRYSKLLCLSSCQNKRIVVTAKPTVKVKTRCRNISCMISSILNLHMSMHMHNCICLYIYTEETWGSTTLGYWSRFVICQRPVITL